MPSGSYIQVYVKCPFYVSDNGKNRIICEGIIPGSQDHCVFRLQNDYRMQIEVFCCDKYQNCEKYAALSKKYEEEESGE